jgi:tight adherence protein B
MSWFAACAGAAGGVAVFLAWPPAGWVLRVRLGPRREPRRVGGWPIGPLAGGGLVVTGAVVALVTARPSIVIIVATAVGAALFVVRQRRLSRERTKSLRTRADTISALDLMAAELRAGILPGAAIVALADEAPFLRPAAVATAHGGDVVAALRGASAQPGASALADLAGAWLVAERAGAPLAQVLDRLASTARDNAEVDREVQAEAAPARATGRLMAVLPVLGLSLGAGMGADPVHVLTGTVVGASCLAGGVALACAGVAWVDRIVASVDAA